MADPNLVYKLAFAELTARLGRTPGIRDPEWLVISNNYSASYSEAREQRIAREKAERTAMVSAAGPGDSCPSRKPAPQARTGGSEARARDGEALSGPGANENREAAKSVLSDPVASPGIYEGAIVGSRGPGGGLYARCVSCQRVWERPKRTGKPNHKCEECR